MKKNSPVLAKHIKTTIIKTFIHGKKKSKSFSIFLFKKFMFNSMFHIVVIACEIY